MPEIGLFGSEGGRRHTASLPYRARLGTNADLPWTRVRSLLRTGAGRTRPQLGEQVSDVFGDDAVLAGERVAASSPASLSCARS